MAWQPDLPCLLEKRVSSEVSDGAEESQCEVGKPEVGFLEGQEMVVRG